MRSCEGDEVSCINNVHLHEVARNSISRERPRGRQKNREPGSARVLATRGQPPSPIHQHLRKPDARRVISGQTRCRRAGSEYLRVQRALIPVSSSAQCPGRACFSGSVES